jgi:hypothetical protein
MDKTIPYHLSNESHKVGNVSFYLKTKILSACETMDVFLLRQWKKSKESSPAIILHQCHKALEQNNHSEIPTL